MPSDKLRTVSIIIPTRNEADRLGACLDSIRALDYPKELIEIIVVDNGSSDKTRDIAAGYDSVCVCRDDNLRVSGLRNLGARRAEGEFLAFVDADCIVAQDWLRQASRYFDAADVAAWGSPPFPPSDSTWVQRAWFVVRSKEKPLEDVDWLESMNLFVRRDHFLSVGGFNEDLVTCEDVDLCYRLRRIGRIVSDTRMHVVHFGEAETVREFVRKELWRGRGNLSGIRSHGWTRAELPSLAIPLYFGVFIPLLILSFFISFHPGFLVAALVAYLFPCMLVLLKVRKKAPDFSTLLGLLVLLSLYFAVRTIAVVKF